MSLPNQLKSARMTNDTVGDTIDNHVADLETAICDILGLPINTNVSAAILEIVATGLKSIILQDAAADPAAAGVIRRNGASLKYHDGTGVKTLATVESALGLYGSTPEVVGAAGAIGNATTASPGNHAHKLGIITTEGDVIQGGTSGTPERLAIGTGMLGRLSNKIAWRAANDARGDLRAAMQPCVTMIRTSDSTNDLLTLATWVVIKPDGTLLDTTGTTSQGLQEAMNYAASNGYDLYVYGSGRKGSAPNGVNAAIISCSAGITVPVLEGVRWDIHATINFGGSGDQGLLFDSVMASTIEFHDQVVIASSYGNGVVFKPQNELPHDSNGPVITSSFFGLPSVVKLGSGVAIDFNATLGAISSNNFRIIEPNGGSIGIRVQVGASTLFDHNHIDVVDCHAQDTCINAGTATTNAQNIYGNTWNVQCDPANGGVAAEIYGLHEKWTISATNLEGSLATGITLNSSAKKNIIEILRNDASTTKINDAATEKSNTIIAPREFLRAHKNGTDQVDLVTGELTDVTFSTEVVDTLGGFDGTTYTCKYPGSFMVIGRVGWKTPTDQAFLATQVMKNGVALAAEYDGASGGTGNQGAAVCAIVECVAGDTLKIQARHDMGTEQDIDGTAAATYLMIQRL